MKIFKILLIFQFCKDNEKTKDKRLQTTYFFCGEKLRLKGNAGGNYWKELIDRIRDIRALRNLEGMGLFLSVSVTTPTNNLSS